MVIRVAIILAYYKEVTKFKLAILSVLGQIYPTWKLYIIVRPSDHALIEAATEFARKDDRIVLLIAEHGEVVTINQVLSGMGESLVCYLVGDGRYYPEKILELIREADCNGGVHLLYSKQKAVYGDGKEEIVFPPKGEGGHPFPQPHINSVMHCMHCAQEVNYWRSDEPSPISSFLTRLSALKHQYQSVAILGDVLDMPDRPQDPVVAASPHSVPPLAVPREMIATTPPPQIPPVSCIIFRCENGSVVVLPSSF